ncbi:chitin deacetylase 8-like [Ostrinia nubilalis]|uniref:chitin deacetylase 8-like n=1 Tax=Ostrinia nubilalis TaxID=29057 RepID=UPI003082585B
MRWSWILLLAAVALAQNSEEELDLAEPCDPQTCQLPECRCASTDIPGNLAPRDTPQFVMVTFDDAVNVINIETYREVLYDRKNSNGCPVGTTFYVNHEYTNYQIVNELYNQGFEIALHSISHRTPQTWWHEAGLEDMRQEFGDQIEQMAQFANIPQDAIHGIRSPFLQLSGNATFQVIKETSLTYDCSWPTITSLDPGLWPYTLDYASTQDCVIPPCPTAALPGVWVVPMVSWRDLQGIPCAMADSCFFTPPMNDEDAWFQFITRNFESHYFGNRSPFGFFVHEWYVRANPAVERALIRFLDVINNIPDVFMVNTKDVVDWVKNPVPVNEYSQKACNLNQPTTCRQAVCGPLTADHTEMQYWMAVCSQCPTNYPWIGNPLGN